VTTDMIHMDYIDAVAAEDMRELKRKEQTYRGSWKRRGGVGAFMMLARKWDRLEGIVSALGRFGGGDRDAHPYDVFKWIEGQRGDGSDGMLLAEVRDLRRYLILVEAEMMARGVVPQPRNELPSTEELMREPVNMVDASQIPGHHIAEIKHGQTLRVETRDGRTEITSAELGHPYEILAGRFEESTCAWDRKAYTRRGNMYRLDEVVPHGVMSYLSKSLADQWYKTDPNGVSGHLRRDRLTDEQREDLTRYPVELNEHEVRHLPEQLRNMYHWDESGNKWRMASEYTAHWGAEP
jgi:hypothetical protein